MVQSFQKNISLSRNVFSSLDNKSNNQSTLKTKNTADLLNRIKQLTHIHENCNKKYISNRYNDLKHAAINDLRKETNSRNNNSVKTGISEKRIPFQRGLYDDKKDNKYKISYVN